MNRRPARGNLSRPRLALLNAHNPLLLRRHDSKTFEGSAQFPEAADALRRGRVNIVVLAALVSDCCSGGPPTVIRTVEAAIYDLDQLDGAPPLLLD